MGRLEVGWGKVACWSTEAAISETRRDGGKVTTEGLHELANALSNGTIRDPLRPPFSQDQAWFATPTQNSNRYYLRNG